MKILVISFTFPPNMDGVSEAAAAITKGFCDKGWSVDVLTEVLPDRRRDSREWHTARIYEYRESPSGELMMEDIDEGSFADFLRRGTWDLVIFQAYSKPLQVAMPVMEKISGRKVLVSHGFPGLVWERNPKFPYGITWMLRRTLKGLRLIKWYRKFDRVVFLSEHSDLKGFYDHWLAKTSGYDGRVVIANGIDLSELGSDPCGFRKENRIPEDAFVFLCVANYSPRKDQAYAARAFRRAAIPNSRLVMIGSEFNSHSDKFKAEDLASAKPDELQQIIWLEKQTREQTLNAYAACQALVLSASHEGQPFVLMEAMREGKPWIARSSGCIEVMEGGLCVKSVGEMSEAMRNFALTPSLRDRLATEGLNAANTRYNRETYVRSYCRLAEELWEERQISPPSLRRSS